MNIIFLFIVAALFVVVTLLVIAIFKVKKTTNKQNLKQVEKNDPYNVQASIAVKTIFDDDFREELRNRGRLHFEKVINDNAMFLQQDLRFTTSQIHDYLKQEINAKLQDEFKKYADTIEYAKKMAVESISKTQTVIEGQRQSLSKQIAEQFESEKTILVSNFENNMAEIINHYLLKAIGDHINLSDQLEFILADLESNKKAIVEDITDGA
ncbi:MAG TPA: hypothetical protein VMR76_01310 [Candidatus Saccharimonadia bacterium]|jgi:hypothetical protein|nr:hypothetical protein [Candidatus Saccharimonadia bacterium]